uniref:Putative ovule protein n=1 Tax=Solanum chacoense TaxID=4108 RepID=A0A0V0HZS4_SOLCH
MVITCAHEFGMDIYATDVIHADFNFVEHNFAQWCYQLNFYGSINLLLLHQQDYTQPCTSSLKPHSTQHQKKSDLTVKLQLPLFCC